MEVFLKALASLFRSQKDRLLSDGEIVNFTSRLPGSFVLASGDFSVRAYSDSARSSYSSRNDAELFSVRGEFEHSPIVRKHFIELATAGTNGRPLGEVKVTVGIGLEPKGELMEVVGDEDVVVEYFEVVGLVVIVEVDHLPNAIATIEVNDVVHDF